MAPLQLVNLIGLATVAVFVASFGVEPANALSGHGLIPDRHAISHRSHDAIAKRKRSRPAKPACRTRPQNGGNSNSTTNSGNGGGNGNNSGNGGDNSNGGQNTGSSDNTSGNNGSNNGDSTGSSNDGNNSGSTSSTTGGNNGGNAGNTGGSTNSTTGGNTGGNTGGTSGGGSQGSGSGKVCLAWPNGDDPALGNFVTPHSGYLYTWSPFMPQDLHGYKPAPMLWGEGQINDFHAQVKQGSAEYLLGFNEPEIDGQSKMTPEHAAQLWKDNIQPYASQGFKLVSPAVTSAPQSKPWLTDFFKACDGCTFDAVAVHYYDTSADGLIKYITDFHTTFNKPVWLTEYACQNFNNGPQCSPDEVTNFMNKVKEFAETTDWVQQYCWFGAMHNMVNVNPANQLMASDGTPNFLGKTFLGLQGY